MDSEIKDQDSKLSENRSEEHQHHAAHHSVHNVSHSSHDAHKSDPAVKLPIYQNTYVKVFLVYLVISLIMFWTVTLNITSSVTNGYGDVHQSLFNLWWVPYSLFVLHQSPYFTNLLYYPIGANLATQTLSPLAGIFIAPIYDLSPALAYNMLYFLGYALSGLFMFMLAKYITKNNYASFIAGLVFAFSPVHVAQSVAHLDWTMIQWIPAFILFYLMALREKNIKYAALAAVSFVLLTFMGDIQQGLLTLFLAIILTILLFIIERKQLLNLDTFKMIGVIIGVTFVLSIPMITLLLPYLTSGVFAVAQQNSAVVSNMQWSDNLLSFLLPSYYNGLFNGIAHSYSYIYQLTYHGYSFNINVGERVSYLGYSVLALALIGIWWDFKKNRLRHSLIWIIMLLIFAWLSIGPYLQIGSYVSGIPGIYMLYRFLPFFNIIREPGRMDFVVTIALAVLAALGFAHITSNKNRHDTYLYLAAFTVLILIEYNGMPLSGSYINMSTTSAIIPKAYYEIGNITGNFSVLILPAISNQSSTPNEYTGTATYYVTAMRKPIIGGYTSRETANQSLAISEIPMAASASYLEYGFGLVYPSPILENYSNLTLLWLANYNTGFVSIIRSAYNLTAQEQLASYVRNFLGPPIYLDNTTIVFSTQRALTNNAGRSITAYTFGNWTPGYSYCNPYSYCNSTLATLWWGDNPRGIVLYSPKAQNIEMSLIALGIANNTPLSVYLNNNLVGTLRLGTLTEKYSLNLTSPQGLNQLTFYSQAGSQYPQQSSFVFGVKNITFT